MQQVSFSNRDNNPMQFLIISFGNKTLPIIRRPKIFLIIVAGRGREKGRERASGWLDS